MSDVFISYAREDELVAQTLAAALESMGWSVWWDRRIQAGSEFSHVIEKELEAATCVIVLWSKQAIVSQYVRDEADVAKNRKVLLPVRIENVQPPLGFRQLHTTELLHWEGESPHPEFDKIVEVVERLTKIKATPDVVSGKRLKRRPSRQNWIIGAIVSTIVLAGGTYYLASNSEPEMVQLPGGKFEMGSTEKDAKDALKLAPKSQATWAEREQPQHTVTLDPFLIDKFEVTVTEFQKFWDRPNNPAQEGEMHPGLENPVGGDHPITQVTWDDAQKFCQWANKQLPSEAQWEYAARSGEKRDYPWGNGPVNEMRANFCDQNCDGPGASSDFDDGFSGTAPVNSFEAGKSSHGVYNLAGNVAEWVSDAYDPRFYEEPIKVNPINTNLHPDGYRVVRGGSYRDGPYFLRAASRNFRPGESRQGKIGFRCVQTSG